MLLINLAKSRAVIPRACVISFSLSARILAHSVWPRIAANIRAVHPYLSSIPASLSSRSLAHSIPSFFAAAPSPWARRLRVARSAVAARAGSRMSTRGALLGLAETHQAILQTLHPARPWLGERPACAASATDLLAGRWQRLHPLAGCKECAAVSLLSKPASKGDVWPPRRATRVCDSPPRILLLYR